MTTFVIPGTSLKSRNLVREFWCIESANVPMFKKCLQLFMLINELPFLFQNCGHTRRTRSLQVLRLIYELVFVGPLSEIWPLAKHSCLYSLLSQPRKHVSNAQMVFIIYLIGLRPWLSPIKLIRNLIWTSDTDFLGWGRCLNTSVSTWNLHTLIYYSCLLP